jgi:hypothetical protein
VLSGGPAGRRQHQVGRNGIDASLLDGHLAAKATLNPQAHPRVGSALSA